MDDIRAALADLPDMVIAAIGESPVLSAPTFRALVEAATADWCSAARAGWTGSRSDLIVAAMSLPNVLDRLRPDVAVIAPSDRTDLIPGLMLAHQSGTFPALAGHPADRWLSDPGDHPPAVRGRAAGSAHRA